jgi:endogenous inhibitor of DNA gyrase (YacG/DUF329 family)
VVWEDTKLVPCPFCDDGTVRVIHIPFIKKDNMSSTVGGRRAKTFSSSTENYQVLEDCPKCGASAKKIEKALNSGQDYKRPSRESVLERMRKAGLPTRI